VQLVPAVTELIIAEILYLQYKDRNKPMFLYINSTGTTRADGVTVSQANITRLSSTASPLLERFWIADTSLGSGACLRPCVGICRWDLKQRAQLSMTP
jgi:hypothetical protein